MATRTKFPEKPHQPGRISFSKRPFGKIQVVYRTFKLTWFEKWKWLHYNESPDAVLCHVCMKAEEEGKLKANSKDLAFLQKGFTNRMDAMEGFRHHEQSKCHQDAIQVMIVVVKHT